MGGYGKCGQTYNGHTCSEETKRFHCGGNCKGINGRGFNGGGSGDGNVVSVLSICGILLVHHLG